MVIYVSRIYDLDEKQNEYEARSTYGRLQGKNHHHHPARPRRCSGNIRCV